MDKKPLELINKITQIIYNKKGFNILALDLREKSTITDVIIIAEGNVARHLISICDEITKELKQIGIFPIHLEGKDSGGWIALDYGIITVHLFLPELREKYRLENLWKEAEVIDLAIDVSKEDALEGYHGK